MIISFFLLLRMNYFKQVFKGLYIAHYSLLEEKNLTTEKIITITYTLGIKRPREEHSEPVEEWISCLAFLQQASSLKLKRIESIMGEKDYVVGLFDGSCRIYNSSHELLHNELFHKDCITDASFLYVAQKCYLATTSSDQTLHLYEYESAKTPRISHIGKYKRSLSALAQNLLNERILAAGAGDGAILLWNLEPLSSLPNSEPETKHKKKKVEISEVEMKKEIIGIHTQEVTAMQFIGTNQLLTGSLDHSIKTVDINKGTAITSLGTNHAGVCALESTHNLVFAGLTDSTIRQWDIRENSLKKTYGEGISSWVKSVAVNPLNRNILASGSYDGKVVLWDIRGERKPLQRICVQKDKVMAVGWNGPKKIVSGGSEGQLYVHSLTFDYAD